MRQPGLALAVLAVVLTGPALAQDVTKRIGVIGRAQEERVPDFAEVEIGVVFNGSTPAAALDGASKAAHGIIATAKEMGVPEADIGTTSLSLDAKTKQVRQPDGSTHAQSDGYEAGNRVRVRLADMGKLGELMRRALDAGANRIEGVSFGLRDPAAAQASVQVAAMKDARAQAERLAQAAGVKLGSALSISSPPRNETPEPTRFFYRNRKVSSAASNAVPIEAGSIETSAEVEAVFAIEP